MAGFIIWISGKWLEWKRLNNVGSNHALSRDDHAHFDAWLKEE